MEDNQLSIADHQATISTSEPFYADCDVHNSKQNANWSKTAKKIAAVETATVDSESVVITVTIQIPSTNNNYLLQTSVFQQRVLLERCNYNTNTI